MAEELIIASGSKVETYKTLVPQIKALTSGEEDLMANCANVAAALKQTFDFFWVGFYIVKDEHLILGPFQGPIACTRTSMGKGVCGSVWEQKQTIIAPDVDLFPGHIACSSESKSEIVVPILKDNEVVAVLDIDSDQLDDFDETDQKYLEELCQYVSEFF